MTYWLLLKLLVWFLNRLLNGTGPISTLDAAQVREIVGLSRQIESRARARGLSIP